MKSAQLESLLDSIEQLQQIMKEIAVGEADLEDEEDNYTQLYKDIELQLDLLYEQGVAVSNPNPFSSLRDWRSHSYSLGKYTDRTVDVYDRYHNTLSAIERFLAHQYVSSGTLPEALADGLHPQSLKNFLANIQEIQSIMKQVARGTSIEDKEATYSKQYRELALQFAILQELELAIPNPNCFRSLWQFYSFWDSELESGYAAREKLINALYEEIFNPISRALYKYETLLTSLESFIQGLKQRFNKNQKSQLTVNTSPVNEGNLITVPVVDLETEDFSQSSLTNVVADLDLDSATSISSSDSITSGNNDDYKSNELITKWRQKRIQQELCSLEAQHDLLSEKLARFRERLAITANFPEQFELEKLIKKIETEMEAIEKKINDLE